MGLINILNAGTWLLLPLNFIFLTFDGIVYSCVAYSYKLFEFMIRMNFNTLLLWFNPLISRINAVIAVVIMFVIGFNLVQYLINPDKALDKSSGGMAILKNIAIASVLLISYRYIFTLINESTFLLVGAPEGYQYSAMFDTFGVKNDPDDAGLIYRFIFGKNKETGDFGKELSVTTLRIFLYGSDGYFDPEYPDAGDASAIGTIYAQILKSEASFNMMRIVSAVDDIGRSVEYRWPIISTAMGAYLIYTILSATIAIGVRSLKLVALQILAPIAIVMIIKDGTKSQVWKKYLSVLGKTYVDAILRIASMLFSVAFFSLAFNRIKELFANDATGITSFFLKVIVAIAAFKFAKDLPSFVDSIFGSHLADNNKNGLGQFLGAAGGAVLGAAGGALVGGISGAKNAGKGFKNRLKGAIGGAGAGLGTGLGKGMMAGYKTKGENVSDYFKAGKDVMSTASQNGSIGIGGFIRGAMDSTRANTSQRELQEINNLESVKNAILTRKGNVAANGPVGTNYNGHNYSFNKMDLSKSMADARKDELAANQNYQSLVRARDAYVATGDLANAQNMANEMGNIEKAYEKAYKEQVGNVLSGDTEYSKMVDSYAKRYASDINKDSGTSRSTDDIAADFKSGDATKSFNKRKAYIAESKAKREARNVKPKDKGGSK